MSQHLVFVYGTLKRGYEFHAPLADQKFVSLATTEAKYSMFDLGSYPGLVHDKDGGQAIEGELYLVDDRCLVQLDKIEEVDSGMYSRETIELQTPTDDLVESYFYLLDVAGRRNCGPSWNG
jgi:gamma-glutamylcyclotransferase (GGCT)/AIG2-like uncharacterized protein YtfP